MFKLIVKAAPVAQPRPRATTRGQHASMYSPTRVKRVSGTFAHPIVAYKEAVRAAAVLAGFNECNLLQSALRVDCCFVFPRPQTLRLKKSPKGRIPHVIKPDRDNLDKAVLDSLTGLVWTDDCLVQSGLIEKWYVAIGEEPHVLVVISRVEVICD